MEKAAEASMRSGGLSAYAALKLKFAALNSLIDTPLMTVIASPADQRVIAALGKEAVIVRVVAD